MHRLAMSHMEVSGSICTLLHLNNAYVSLGSLSVLITRLQTILDFWIGSAQFEDTLNKIYFFMIVPQHFKDLRNHSGVLLSAPWDMAYGITLTRSRLSRVKPGLISVLRGHCWAGQPCPYSSIITSSSLCHHIIVETGTLQEVF